MTVTEEYYLSLPYRPGVGVMMINNENKILVGRRIDTKEDAWQMPQGGIDDGESPYQAALRELKEEIGTCNVELISCTRNWFYYDIPEYLVDKLWNGKYRGQKQKWFLVRFLGQDEEIDVNTEVPEFMSWRWASVEELPEIIVPFKRRLYSEIIEEFEEYFK